MRQSVRSGRWVGRGCALLALAAIALAALPTQSGTAHAAADPGYLVAPTSSTTNLIDGQRILINLKSTSPDVSISFVEIHECATLLNMQLDEHADPAQSLVIAAKLRGVDASSAHRLIEAHTADIDEPASGLRRESARR